MTTPSRGLLYVLIFAILSVVLAFLFGLKGLESFYVASIGTFFIFTWFLVQGVKRMYAEKAWLIVKLFLTGAAAAFLFVAFVITVSSWPFDTNIETNWWIVLVGILPFIIPRLGVYKKASKTDKVSTGVLVSLLSIILFFMAANALRNDPSSLQQYALVIVVQIQFIFTYIALQTHYIERSISAVLSVLDKRVTLDENTRFYALLLTAGLPFLVPVVAIFLLSL